MKPRNRRSQLGSAALEFALSWSLLSTIFMGVYQFGYAFYVYNAVMSSAAGAGNMASRLTYDTGNPSVFTTKIQNMVLYGDTTAGTAAIVPGLTASNVNVAVAMNNSIPTDVTITIVNYQIDAVFKKFTFNGKPRVTVAYLGQVTCSTC